MIERCWEGVMKQHRAPFRTPIIIWEGGSYFSFYIQFGIFLFFYFFNGLTFWLIQKCLIWANGKEMGKGKKRGKGWERDGKEMGNEKEMGIGERDGKVEGQGQRVGGSEHLKLMERLMDCECEPINQ